jgi:hypothetical protein
MARRLLSIALLFCTAAAAFGGSARLPLDPAVLAGAEVFTAAEEHVAAAAQAAGLAFVPDSRPLPPQVLLPLDTADGRVQKRRGCFIGAATCCPTSSRPRNRHARPPPPRSDGGWKTVAPKKASRPRPAPISCGRPRHGLVRPADVDPRTPYQLGTLAGAPVRLVLWRTATEDSAPLGGFIEIPDAPAALRDALNARLAPFAAQADWAAEFDAFAR